MSLALSVIYGHIRAFKVSFCELVMKLLQEDFSLNNQKNVFK